MSQCYPLAHTGASVRNLCCQCVLNLINHAECPCPELHTVCTISDKICCIYMNNADTRSVFTSLSYRNPIMQNCSSSRMCLFLRPPTCGLFLGGYLQSGAVGAVSSLSEGPDLEHIGRAGLQVIHCG